MNNRPMEWVNLDTSDWPAEFEDVLLAVTIQGVTRCVVGYLEIDDLLGGGWRYTNNDGLIMGDTTHWMPLPPLPIP